MPRTNHFGKDFLSEDPTCLFQVKCQPYRAKAWVSVMGGTPKTTINRVIRHNARALGLESSVYRSKSPKVRRTALRCITYVSIFGPYITARLWRLFNWGRKLLHHKNPATRRRGIRLLRGFTVKFAECGLRGSMLRDFVRLRQSGSTGSPVVHPEGVIPSEDDYSGQDLGSDEDLFGPQSDDSASYDDSDSFLDY